MEPNDVVVDRILRELLVPSSNESNANISINAGGVGVWLASTACLVMLGMMIIGGIWAAREFDRIDQQLTEARAENSTLRTYISSIWQQAPHLKPKQEPKEK